MHAKHAVASLWPRGANDSMPEEEDLPAPADEVAQEAEGAAADGGLDMDAALDDDWARVAERLRRRKVGGGAALRDEEESEDGEEAGESRLPREVAGRQGLSPCCLYALTFLLTCVLVGGVVLWGWLYPRPLDVTLEFMRPQKFKIDVTEFFAPKVSAALQLVLSIKNTNLLRAMLLEECKLCARTVQI